MLPFSSDLWDQSKIQESIILWNVFFIFQRGHVTFRLESIFYLKPHFHLFLNYPCVSGLLFLPRFSTYIFFDFIAEDIFFTLLVRWKLAAAMYYFQHDGIFLHSVLSFWCISLIQFFDRPFLPLIAVCQFLVDNWCVLCPQLIQ